ncbi:protein YrbN [Biostraticola tofi]
MTDSFHDEVCRLAAIMNEARIHV